MTGKPAPEEVEMIYLGRRWTTKPAPGYAWAEASDPERTHVFAKVKGTAVGSVYMMQVERDESGRVSSAYVGPVWTNVVHSNSDQVAAWQAIDLQVRGEDNRRRAEKRAAQSSELDLALNPLRNMLRHTRSYTDAEAILAIVHTKLMREWGEGKLR